MDHNLLQYGVVAFVAFAAILGHSAARELRPSEHGLEYQETSSPPPIQNDAAQEMRSFFGTTTSSPVELPEAKNISDTWISAHAEGGGEARDAGRDHVRLGLLVASAVCGLTGVVLLAISGVVFLYRLQKRRPKADGIPSTSALASLPNTNANAIAANKSSG